MKRKIQSISRASKRRKTTHNIIHASHLYNYMIKDPLVDWFKLSSRNNIRPIQKPSFIDFIKDRGNEFEAKLVKYINDNKIKVQTVSTFFSEEECAKTIKLMKEGVPLLHSVCVKNKKNNTGGIIDLLIRSDYFDKLVEDCPLTEEEKCIRAPKLKQNYHYVVIDIKFSTLPLRADGRHLLNSKNYPAYKAQTLIYTEAVGEIQGYTSRYAFIMGRRWKYKSKNLDYCNDICDNKLGVIDFKGIDNEYISKTKDAIKWRKSLLKDGDTWSINPPSRIELYPNMCIDSGIWNQEKKKLADDIGDITSLWYCGNKNRDIAISNNITSWKDKRCNSKNIGVNGNRGLIIDKIIKINKQDKIKILPKKILNNFSDWKDGSNELYVDFETISDIFSDFNELPKQSRDGSMIFMIGVGWGNKGVWNYKSFICESLTRDSEFNIMNDFCQFVKARGNPKIVYWHAEKNFWNTAESRQFDKAKGFKREIILDNFKLDKWVDLCGVFKAEPIVIKGCFKFGLKEIAKAMKSHGMISHFNSSECDSGMTAMVKAFECYRDCSNPVSSNIMKDIEKYNEFDCKVLFEIIEYLRKNHV